MPSPYAPLKLSSSTSSVGTSSRMLTSTVMLEVVPSARVTSRLPVKPVAFSDSPGVPCCSPLYASVCRNVTLPSASTISWPYTLPSSSVTFTVWFATSVTPSGSSGMATSTA